MDLVREVEAAAPALHAALELCGEWNPDAMPCPAPAAFSPAIFRASLENTTLDELLLAARKLAASALAIYLLANETGLLGLGVIYWLYRNGFF